MQQNTLIELLTNYPYHQYADRWNISELNKNPCLNLATMQALRVPILPQYYCHNPNFTFNDMMIINNSIINPKFDNTAISQHPNFNIIELLKSKIKIDVNALNANKNVNIETLRNYNFKINPDFISLNINIGLADVLKNQDIAWNYSNLSYNTTFCNDILENLTTLHSGENF